VTNPIALELTFVTVVTGGNHTLLEDERELDEEEMTSQLELELELDVLVEMKIGPPFFTEEEDEETNGILEITNLAELLLEIIGMDENTELTDDDEAMYTGGNGSGNGNHGIAGFGMVTMGICGMAAMLELELKTNVGEETLETEDDFCCWRKTIHGGIGTLLEDFATEDGANVGAATIMLGIPPETGPKTCGQNLAPFGNTKQRVEKSGFFTEEVELDVCCMKGGSIVVPGVTVVAACKMAFGRRIAPFFQTMSAPTRTLIAVPMTPTRRAATSALPETMR
jgi:hypothetical protein